MELKELVNQFLDFEKNYFRYQEEGCSYWELLRFSIFRSLTEELGIMDKAQDKLKPGFMDRIGQIGKSLPDYILRSPLWGKKKDLFFNCSPRRRLREDGRYWDIYSDYLLKILDPQRAYALESYYQDGHFKPPRTENLKYFDIYNVGMKIRMKLSKYKLSSGTEKWCREIEKEIKVKWGVTVNVRFRLRYTISSGQERERYYIRLLKRTQPKIVFLVVGYGKEYIVSACRRLGIPSVELQHGVISSYHMGYEFGGEEKKLFPDYLFVFGPYWKQSCRFPVSQDRIKVLGYPYLTESGEITSTSRKEETNLLFISQGVIGRALAEFAVRCAHLLPDYNVQFKLHPGELKRWRQDYSILLDSAVEVIEDSKATIYELYRKTNWVFGVYSTALYEAFAFDCRVVIVDLPGVDYMQDLIQKGYAKLIKEPEQVPPLLKSWENNTNQPDPDFFFDPDWKNNFRRLLKEILPAEDTDSWFKE